jgi:hypothetical protein
MLSFVNRQQQLSSPAPQLFLHSFGRSSPFPRVVVETCWVKRMMADVVTEKKRDLGTGWIGERFERTHRTAVLARAGPAANGRSGAGTRSLAGRSIASGGVRLTRPGWIRCCCRAGRVAKTLTDASLSFATIAQKQCSVLLCFRVARAASFVGCLFLKPECVHRLWLLLAALTR